MSNKYKILEMLKQNELTVKEIANKTEFNENEVRVYIHRLLKDNLIKEIGKKNKYFIYIAIEKESNDAFKISLRKLYNFMSNEVKCELKEINESDISFLTKIKELIQ